MIPLFFGPISVLLRLEFILVGETFPNAELLFPLTLLLMFLWSLESSSVQHKGQEATHDENINWPHNQPTLYLSSLRQNVSWDGLVSRKMSLTQSHIFSWSLGDNTQVFWLTTGFDFMEQTRQWWRLEQNQVNTHLLLDLNSGFFLDSNPCKFPLE